MAPPDRGVRHHPDVRSGWGRALIVTVLVGLAASGCAELPVVEPPAPRVVGGDAVTVLATLPVKGRAPRTGYEREQFGERWQDIDHNGCDQRNDVLARDLAQVAFQEGTHSCVVRTGVLHDPYSGQTVPFTRGQDTSDDVQIDHVVALSNAWQTGAQQLDEATRERFANDLLNLMATDGRVNQAKGDADAATWLPPSRGFRCAYVARQVAVKAKYGLWVTPAEHDAISRVLTGCPGEPLPPDSGVDPA